ncbi:hypothetical protein [Rubellimicrobium roseum]|uniref:Uncharacterized protein n=1 Tax=Rubellimicrobium roseum TaxID=687525 RepID=A0A5C4NET0_9RHOB|nr:hypothetical protein [Rubellimicrobium roseum]TNC69471.1 hypothetical protein FHG71_13740 [Rubellimicrobium roseum]
MADHETELEMVQRHVREGEAHVKRQREIVAELRERGHPTDVAIALLAEFEDLLRQHKAHLVRIEATKSAPHA